MAEPRKAVFRVLIAAKIEDVFREITRTDRPQAAVYDAMLVTDRLGPGGRMQLRTASGRHTIVDGEILEYDPPRRFAHTHRFTQHDDPVCRVIYELRPAGTHVEVTLTVEDLPVGTRTARSMQSGGPFILGNLKAVAERGRPALGTRLMYAAMGALEFMLPARTRSERWPLSRGAPR
ncbi:MAG TPA: SRPBCC domain-containing protein [Usitatibacter sp.]|nr:SRPBCC domain-containing protein [Usitatibacter sp.]